ncbi:hypothetical protein [Motilibacter deserti]|uniref:HTTM-like domain-containing protein n=1 Tax=Motilibacter deserti TaxID=2714956 RepID=A0ABX0GVW0_9ACTN|nr:hypothetical protein [Motilibacter deserti]NHC13944.1 hypothetical protein [Motilibacter deserti]
MGRPVTSRLERWLAPAVPLARLAVVRRLLALFVLADIALLTADVVPHAKGPDELYQPLLLRRALDLPAPGPAYVEGLAAVLVVAALVVAVGRLPRLAGAVLAVAFLDWVSIAFSYGKIDHDHFALVVGLFAVATVGPAGLRDPRTSAAAGFALRAVQVACVATYFLSAVAKVRFGGWGWATGATFAWAMSRRGTQLGDVLAQFPWLLRAGQWGVLVMEALTPALLFVRARWQAVGATVLVGFHLATWAATRIHFLPLVVCLAAFLPLERIVPAVTGLRRRRATPRRAADASRPAAAGAPACGPPRA